MVLVDLTRSIGSRVGGLEGSVTLMIPNCYLILMVGYNNFYMISFFSLLHDIHCYLIFIVK